MKLPTKAQWVLLIAVLFGICQIVRADYPIVSHRYLADPGALVHNGRVYLYCSNDDDNTTNDSYLMQSIVCVSSSDMKNWTDHGEVFRVPANAAWASRSWAPAVAARNNQFYLYFGNNASGIGVAASTSPIGPFTDAKGGYLINSSTPGASGTNMWYFDPAVFIDDDNQVYLYFGGNGESNGRVIQLNSDMINVSGSATSITAPGYFEAAWMHKRNGIYYFSYSTNTANGLRIDYMTSNNPMTGFTYRGIVAGQPPSNNNNNHAASFNFNGNWYHAYHNRHVATQAGIPTVYRRNLALENLNHNVDGTIQQIAYTTNGVTQTANVDPYARVEAETMAGQSSIETEPCSEGGMNVTAISNNDWILVRGVDFGTTATGFSARVAGTTGGAIELRLDSLAGLLIGTCSVPSTGGPQSWTTVTCPVNTATAQGVRDLYLKFTGTGDGLFNMNWWQFASSATLPPVPTGLTARLESNSQVTLSWTAAPGATSYRVKRSLNSGGPYTMIAENIAGTSHTDTAVSRGLTYYYVVSAITPPLESLNSDQVGLTVANLLAPVADAYVRDGGSAANNFGTVEDLAVKLDTSGFNRESFLRFSVTALSNATSARLRLTPVSGSSDLATTQLNYEFMATDLWNETGVTWNNKPPGSGIVLASLTGYGIGTAVEIDISGQTNTEAAGDGNLSLRISSVVAGSGRIVSFGSRENVTEQNRPVIEYLLPGPAAPTGLTATPGNMQASLTWAASPGATSYLVKRATAPGGPYVVVASGITTTSHIDSGLANWQPYFYVVSAVNAENQSANSGEADVLLGTDRYLHLRLDETSGTTATDSSGNNRNGTLVNGPVWVAGANSKVTGALSFDGTNYHVTLPAGVVSTLQDFTISTWVKLNAVSDFMRIFDISSGGNAYMFLTPRATDTQTARFGITLTGGSASQERIHGTAALPTGVWTHVAVTVAGSTGTLYVNGVAVGSNTSMTLKPSSLGNTTLNYLGRSPTTNYLNGSLDEFQIFSRALSASEIAGMVTPPAAPTGLILVGNALGWNAVANADFYTVKRSSNANGPFVTIESGISGTSFIDTTAVGGVSYFYVVSASNGPAESSNSATTTAAPPAHCEIVWNDNRQPIDGFGGGVVFLTDSTLTNTNADTLFLRNNANQLGLSLLRVRVAPNESWATSNAAWSGALTEAQRAVSRGARVMATPWTPPASMKDNNSLIDGGHLLPERYADYASYLNKFATYLGSNGAPLAVISLQNEPDWPTDYESCLWTAAEFNTFCANNAGAITAAPLMMPESLRFSQSYSDATLDNPAAAANVDYIGGHLYGNPVITEYPKAHSLKKNTWMTEFLINDQTWPSAMVTAEEIHNCLATGNMSAYIWWKCLGDINGLVNASGVVQKRGFMMAQFSRFVRPGFVRIGTINQSPTTRITAFKNPANGEFAIVAINSGGGPVSQIFDLGSFAATSVTPWITSETQSLALQSPISVIGNSFQHLIPASSVVTYVGTATATQPDLAGARFRMDETSGPTANNSSGSANGTLAGGAGWAAGILNNAVSLDGSDDHVTLPTGVVGGLDDFTISCWVNLDTISTWSRIFDFGTGTTNYMFLTPRHTNTSGTLRFAIRTPGTTEQVITGPAALSPGGWTHVAVTLSGTTGRLFVNGQFVGRNTNMTLQPSDLGATTANHIGRSQFGGDPYLDGRVDEFQIFDRELSYWDIATLAAPPAAPTGLATAPGDRQVTLSWSAVTGTNGYIVKRSNSAGGPFATIAEGVKTTGFTDTGLVNGTTYHYLVTALKDSAESASSAPASTTPLQNFDQWIAAAFPGQTNPTVIGPNADPDFDGYDNLIEYFMGTSPSASGSAGMVAASCDGSGNLEITFRMSKYLTGVSYSVQSSTGLTGWTDTGVTASVVSDEGDHFIMQASIPGGTNTGFFLRVAVTEQ